MTLRIKALVFVSVGKTFVDKWMSFILSLSEFWGGERQDFLVHSVCLNPTLVKGHPWHPFSEIASVDPKKFDMEDRVNFPIPMKGVVENSWGRQHSVVNYNRIGSTYVSPTSPRLIVSDRPVVNLFRRTSDFRLWVEDTRLISNKRGWFWVPLQTRGHNLYPEPSSTNPVLLPREYRTTTHYHSRVFYNKISRTVEEGWERKRGWDRYTVRSMTKRKVVLKFVGFRSCLFKRQNSVDQTPWNICRECLFSGKEVTYINWEQVKISVWTRTLSTVSSKM